MARFALRLALLACVLGATSARRSWSPRASPTFVSAPSLSRAPVVPPSRVAQQQPRGGAVAVSMLAGSTIAGIAAGVGGLAFGIGVIAFTEKQGERMEERGSEVMSVETKSKLAGMFMEDAEIDAGIDDTIEKMERAMAEAKGKDLKEYAVETGVTREKLTDGWED